MDKTEDITLKENELLFLSGENGTVAVVKAGHEGQYFLETQNEEIILGLEPHDLIVASAFSTGDVIKKGLKSILYTIRELKSPLVVLPKNHPASKRMKAAVSAGNKTFISCDITPGTHPEQDIVCGSTEFNNLEISGTYKGVRFSKTPQCEISKVLFDINIQ
ncbi:conserved hypothetical protein [Methanohalobium evestigatum Z-7303]|uniref:Uncharacterized protein n=1 Tax=Methanohalobium evestigatum (strain ATCC BAA-1072 / DSM 3721 / NBRC 107634 / OCM 161 / Z-7303) TaxID=644295 RepID=D7E9X5_METEZ|nr:hypothetical protein [Methanohalobium evestigatum]ADI74397.1 conserved hypothetical protein [Methanohalobium evestigatum Z-7303]